MSYAMSLSSCNRLKWKIYSSPKQVNINDIHLQCMARHLSLHDNMHMTYCLAGSLQVRETA